MKSIKTKQAKALVAENQKGFTLIEVISVLIIMGVMASVAVKKFDLLSDNASLAIINSALRELKARESVTWFDIKVSGYTNDLDVYNAVDKTMGLGIKWDPGPNISGGTLNLKSVSVNLTRIPSTVNSPGTWK